MVLVRDFAATLPAEIEWTVGGEEMLILALEHGDLDLVIGGLTADTPWEKHAAITKPYAEATDPGRGAGRAGDGGEAGRERLPAPAGALPARAGIAVSPVTFGSTELPERQAATLRKAIRYEWITIAFLAFAITLVGLVAGNSQAMKVAWAEDMLSLAPPLAFLVAVRIIRHPPTAKRPYGYHRSVGVGHLVAAVALTAMGSFLIYDSAVGLLTAEHPSIGSVQLFGQVFWLGWLMMAAMVITGVPPVLLGRVKLKLAEELHDKVLYADAKMNKADWMTALGSLVGVAGIGIGWWWADGAAALFISLSILSDGIKNLRSSILDLTDVRATTFDNKKPHPVIGQVEDYLRGLDWVAAAGVRARDEGHVFHVEGFVVPKDVRGPSVEELEEARRGCAELDWRLHDVVLVPVPRLPLEVGQN